jgi:cytoskeletal protein CcmA (bactofilin family)
MNVKPYPKEQIVLTKLLEEDKGLTLQIRQAETKIPLRLARKLMMDGLDIQGDVYASGVGTRKQVRREAEEEEEKRKKTKLELVSRL